MRHRQVQGSLHQIPVAAQVFELRREPAIAVAECRQRGFVAEHRGRVQHVRDELGGEGVRSRSSSMIAHAQPAAGKLKVLLADISVTVRRDTSRERLAIGTRARPASRTRSQ